MSELKEKRFIVLESSIKKGKPKKVLGGHETYESACDFVDALEDRKRIPFCSILVKNEKDTSDKPTA